MYHACTSKFSQIFISRSWEQPEQYDIFDLIRSLQTSLLVRRQKVRENSQISCLLSLDGLENHINSANISLVAQLNISKASEKPRDFGTNRTTICWWKPFEKSSSLICTLKSLSIHNWQVLISCDLVFWDYLTNLS